jgi:hypothetical protein
MCRTVLSILTLPGLVAVTTLLLLAGASRAEEYKSAKITKATGTAVTLSWKEEQKTKTAVVYVGKSTKGTDAAGKELKGQQLAKILKAGTLVDVTTEKVPATQVGLRFKGDVEVIKEMDARAEPVEIRKVAPDIVGADIDGKKFKLSDYRGKVVVLDFWGNW